MSESKSQNVDSLTLPSSDAKDVKWSEAELKHPDVDAMVRLIHSYLLGTESQAREVIEFFMPLARAFQKNVSLGLPNTELERRWVDFSCFHIVEPLLKTVEESGIEQEQLPPEIYSYPNFAKRRVSEILRVESPELHAQLCTIFPFAAFTCRQLWHPNEENSHSVREYFRTLGAAFLAGKNVENIEISDFLRFCCGVKSPYREMYEKFESFESDRIDESIKVSSVLNLCITRAGVLHRLRDDQVMGVELGELTSPAPILPAALKELSISWLADESEVFFNRLPSRLLAYISETRIDVFQKLAQQYGVFGGRFTESENAESTWLIPLEFPQIQKTSFVYRHFSSIDEMKCPEKLKRSQSSIALLCEVHKQNENELLDINRDSARVRAGIAKIRERKELCPWESPELFKELRLLEKRFERANARKKSVKAKQSWIESRTKLLDGDVLGLDAKSEPIAVNSDAVEQRLLNILDSILLKDKTREEFSLSSFGIVDPLFSEGTFSFTAEVELGKAISKKLKSHSVREVHNALPHATNAVEHVAAWLMLKKTKSLKKLRRKFSREVADRVFIEQQVRALGKSFESVREAYPEMSRMTYLVEEKYQLESYFKKLTNRFEELVSQVFRQAFPKHSYANFSALSNEQLRQYDLVFDVIWVWFFKGLRNPYGEQSKTFEFDELFQKRSMFLPWFQHEFGKQMSLSGSRLHECMAFVQPVAFLGLESAIDFNWRASSSLESYTETLSSRVLRVARLQELNGFSLLKLYKSILSQAKSPFVLITNENQYSIELVSNLVLQLDGSQQHLYTSKARRILVRHWSKYHHFLFQGHSKASGILSALLLKTIEKLDSERHLDLLAAHNEEERESLQRDRAYYSLQRESSDEENNQYISDQITILDDRIFRSQLDKEAFRVAKEKSQML